MIKLILSSLGSKWETYYIQAGEYQNLWLETYDDLMENSSKRISSKQLEQFRQFKLDLLKDIIAEPD
jgi:hypothetical protein